MKRKVTRRQAIDKIKAYNKSHEEDLTFEMVEDRFKNMIDVSSYQPEQEVLEAYCWYKIILSDGKNFENELTALMFRLL